MENIHIQKYFGYKPGNNHTSPSESLSTIHPMSSSLQCVANVSREIHNEKHIYHICLQICCSKTVGKQQTSTSYIPCYFGTIISLCVPILTQPFKFDTWKQLNERIDSFRHVTFSPLLASQHMFPLFQTNLKKNSYSPFGLSTQRFRIQHQTHQNHLNKKSPSVNIQLIPKAWGKQQIM